jgi:hypothetical protein
MRERKALRFRRENGSAVLELNDSDDLVLSRQMHFQEELWFELVKEARDSQVSEIMCQNNIQLTLGDIHIVIEEITLDEARMVLKNESQDAICLFVALTLALLLRRRHHDRLKESQNAEDAYVPGDSSTTPLKDQRLPLLQAVVDFFKSGNWLE